MKNSLLRSVLCLAFIAAASMCLMPQVRAQDKAAKETTQATTGPTTTSDATIPMDHLKVVLRPLTKPELDVELAAWLGLLKTKIGEVGDTELKLKALDAEAEDAADTEEDAPPPEAKQTLSEKLLALRTEEVAIAERTRIVIDALAAKGGDVAAAQSYLDAVSDLGETTDATSLIAASIAQVSAWAGRDDGGKLWLKKLVVAVVVLLFFWIVSKSIGLAITRRLDRSERASNLLTNFARRTVGGAVMLLGIVMALGTLGVPLGPLMAALGGGGFIVGFALQETLGNFASGLLIMVYRPFDLDDYVNVAGVEGTVKHMSLVSTTLVTLDNKHLIIPNKSAWGGTITNFTASDLRRVDLVFGIGYDDDLPTAIDVLKQIAADHELVLSEPATTVHVDALADSSVNLFCRPWVKTADYWTVHWDLTREVKQRFDAEGIHIPYPQQDVHYQPATAPV